MGFLTGKTAIITGAGRAVLNDGRCGSIGSIDVQLRTSEHRSMYSYVRLSIDRCTATYV